MAHVDVPVRWCSMHPVTILGLEPDDFAVVAATPLLLALVLDAVASFGGALLLGAGVYLAKRGRPPGALLHRLHALELTRCQACCRPGGSATRRGRRADDPVVTSREPLGPPGRESRTLRAGRGRS